MNDGAAVPAPAWPPTVPAPCPATAVTTYLACRAPSRSAPRFPRPLPALRYLRRRFARQAGGWHQRPCAALPAQCPRASRPGRASRIAASALLGVCYKRVDPARPLSPHAHAHLCVPLGRDPPSLKSIEATSTAAGGLMFTTCTCTPRPLHPPPTFVSWWSGATPERTRPKGVGSRSYQENGGRRRGGHTGQP